MRIRSLEAIPVGLPFRRTYLTATGRLERREIVIVRVETEDGVVGWGDAVPMSLRGGPGTDAVRSDVTDLCGPEIAGLSLGRDPRASLREAFARCRRTGAGAPALSGVDTALLDLIGKLAGEPLWRVLGAGSAGTVECNGTLGADDPEAASSLASELTEAGFGTIKVKVGTGEDRARVEAVRAACGPSLKLRIDANGAWGEREAIAVLADLGAAELELIEQPCRRIEELAAVRAASGMRIVADESVSDLGEARAAMTVGAIDAATLKLSKVGGPTAALEIAAAVPAYLSSALDSVIGIAAAAHTARAIFPRQFAAGLAHGLATSSLFTDNVGDDTPLRGPSIALTDAPGIGVEVDEDAIGQLRIR